MENVCLYKCERSKHDDIYNMIICLGGPIFYFVVYIKILSSGE